MNRKTIYLVLPVLVAITIILFHPTNSSNKMDIEIIKQINVISQSNIYFGHKSVGQNIIAGMNKIIKVTGQNGLKIEELSDSIKYNQNYFLHSNIGENGYPKGKFREFSKIVNDLERKNLDIAMMKLCFVDITEKTDISDIFQSYTAMIDSLRNKYPALVIIHFTVPLKSEPDWINNLKNIIKRRTDNDVKDNLARNKYNELLLKKYSNEDIFDIANIESTYPDGKREIVTVDDKQCYSLIKNYTYDGGHLNEKGQELVAEKLINKIYERIKFNKVNINHDMYSSEIKSPLK